MEPVEQSRIPTRTRRRAMDWGLVLLSQGITATMDDGADGSGWGLWVAASDYPAAMQAIRLYQWENRHWRWRQPLTWQGFSFDWKVVFWGVLLVAIHITDHAKDLHTGGQMDNSAVRAGEWWRIFTAVLLHANIAHLASNVSLGMVLLGLAMGRFGSGPGLLAAYLAGAAGNVAGLLFYREPHYGLGASGMVMGALGLLAAQSVSLLRHGTVGTKYLLRALMAGIILFALFGLSPDADVLAHATGFVAGLVFGGILLSLPSTWQNRTSDATAAIIFAGLVLITEWLALRKG